MVKLNAYLWRFKTIYEVQEPDLHKELVILHGRYNRLRSDGKVSMMDERKEMGIISEALGKYTRGINKSFVKEIDAELLSKLEHMIEA